MDRTDSKIHRGLIDQWDELKLCMRQLYSGASVAPDSGYNVFKYAGSSALKSEFDIGPVMFNLPERASHVSADLHIVIQGRLSLDRVHFEDSGQVRTAGFGTEVGYFRLGKDGRFRHIYGAHYDYAESQLGHPVFHVHMQSYAELYEVIQKKYAIDDSLAEDGMKSVLRTVRLPSAQMDVFSLVLQLIADHLLWEQSSQEDQKTFNALVETGKAIQGAGAYVERLQIAPANKCYRAVHWYSAPSGA